MQVIEEKDENENDFVSVILVRMPNLTQSGFGTSYHILVPEGFG